MLLTSHSSNPKTGPRPPRGPRHVAVIMDGNGRWAKERGWPRTRGHYEGAKAVRECMQGCLDHGVEYLTLYAFSTDNWRRPKEEVDTLMALLKRWLREYTREMNEKGVRIEAIGRWRELPKSCREELQGAMESTAQNTRLTTILAVNYSGRGEIVDAVKQVLADVEAGLLSKEQLDANVFQRYLYTSPWPDPDLLIRTSGEMRVSNFLLWQVSYTEFFSIEKYWPDFTRDDLRLAVEAFAKRQRRYGGL